MYSSKNFSFTKQFGNIPGTNKRYISLEEAIKKYDHDNLLFFDQPKYKESEKMKEYLYLSYKVTPSELQDNYGNKVIEIINNMQKSQTPAELPKLQFGKQLTDDEFLQLLIDCVSYASYKLTKENLENIRSRLLTNSKLLKNIFVENQILKDLLENCLIAILTDNNEANQDDNFNILFNAYISTTTPFIQLEFNYNNTRNILDKKELIDTFCSKIYLYYYYKSLDEFIPNFKSIVKDENCLKPYIQNYFEKYNIYFCKMPNYMMANTIHTGNVYLKGDYLEEYFNNTDSDSQLIIREKLILNLAHELMHALCREISPEMRENFLKNSEKKTKLENDEIKFRDKFVSNFHLEDSNESGNFFDFNFFDGMYFNELYKSEAEFFLDIKNKNDVGDYVNQLNSVIFNEKNKKLPKQMVNKFKKLENERPKCKRPGSVKLDYFKYYGFMPPSEKDKIESQKDDKKEH